MTKRFKETARVWIQYGLFLMKQGRPDAARRILEKSLKAVNKKQRKGGGMHHGRVLGYN